MNGIKESLFWGIKRVLPRLWWDRLWSYYIKNNSKYDDMRYQYAYFLSSKKSKKKYCIKREVYPYQGIIASATSALFAYEWAEKNNMILVIDAEWEWVYENYLLGVENRWEYIFKNPIPIEKAIKEKNVYVTGKYDLYATSSMANELNTSVEEFRYKRNLVTAQNWRKNSKILNHYCNKWLQFQDNILERYKKTFSKLFFPDMKKILAVSLREEFAIDKKEYQGTSLGGHPYQPGVEEMIETIRTCMQKWNCTHVYVTTYMQDSIDILQKEFGDSLLFTNRRRVSFEKYKLARKKSEEYARKGSKELYEWVNSEDELGKIVNTYDRETVIEYVEEIYGISLCDCYLASGLSSGVLMACVWNGGKYEHMEILPDKPRE